MTDLVTTLAQSMKLKEPYERYSVTSEGKIISTYWKSPRFISQHVINGYPAVSLREKTFKVHRLVAESFIPNPDGLPCVNHLDGNKKNNTVQNLEWCSYSDNMTHAYSNGLTVSKKGSSNGRSKLKEEDIEVIRRSNISGKIVARSYGVSETVISKIRKGKRWSHV